MTHPRVMPIAVTRFALPVVLGLGAALWRRAGRAGVDIRQLDDRLRIEIDGELFAEYYYRDVSRPFLYPVRAAGGEDVSRHWPIREADNEERDHPHHRSLWYAHGEVNGHDFWSESGRAGKTVHVEFSEVRSGPEVGIIRSRNQLVTREGDVLGTEDFVLRIYRATDFRLLDFDVTIHASHGDLVFGDTKEGTMAIRLAETMRLRPNKFNEGKPTGHIVNSEGVRDGATWGKRAAWVDYCGPVDGEILGVAIFDHPTNPRHPTWWHVRDYGLFAANPFGVHDFENKPAGTGNLRVPSGESMTFRYRFYIHSGDETAARVAERYQEYVASPDDR